MTAPPAPGQPHVLIFGATGFIGRRATAAFREAGWKVTAALRRPDAGAGLPEGVGIRGGADLDVPASLAAAVTDLRPDAVLQAAASSADAGAVSLSRLLASDAAGLAALTEAMAGIAARAEDPPRLVVLGSALAYGPSDKPLSEDAPLDPEQPYGMAKAVCARIAAHACRHKGLPVVELRLFNVYGPGDLPPRLVPSCIEAALAGAPLRLTSGAQARDFVHVDDVVRAILAAAGGQLPPGAYNVATGTAHSVETVARRILALSGSASTLELGALTARHDRHRVLCGDPARLAAQGLRPRIALDAGLAQTIAATRTAAATAPPAAQTASSGAP